MTIRRRKIIAIPGSTRNDSTNHHLIKAIIALAAADFEISIFDGIAGLPHFNPDFADENIPEPVVAFKQLLNHTDGVIICTPEYAHGVPGTLKNAIDWTVASNEFSHKPTLLITASTDGKNGHQAMLETLKVLEAENVENLQLLIPFARTKINKDNTIADEKTLTAIKRLLASFKKVINEKEM